MAEFYNDVLDIDECVSKIFSNHEIATVEKMCPDECRVHIHGEAIE